MRNLLHANELRVNNTIKLFLGVNDDGAQYREYAIQGIKNDFGDIKIKLDDSDIWHNTGNFEPIVLNNVILENMGFKLATDNEHFFLGHFGFCLVFDGNDYCLKSRIDEPYVILYIRYFHQLQNIYQLLTKEEL